MKGTATLKFCENSNLAGKIELSIVTILSLSRVDFVLDLLYFGICSEKWEAVLVIMNRLTSGNGLIKKTEGKTLTRPIEELVIIGPSITT